MFCNINAAIVIIEAGNSETNQCLYAIKKHDNVHNKNKLNSTQEHKAGEGKLSLEFSFIL